MSRIIISCFIVFILIPAAWAEPLALRDAVETARQNNPDLASAKAQWEAAKAKIPQAVSLTDPKLGVESDQIPSGSRNLNDGMMMYTAEQMIMFPGKIYADWRAANAEAARSEANYQAKVLETAAQVKSSYYDLFYADQAVKAISEIKDLLAGVKKTAEAKYSVGSVPQTDVLLANIEYLTMDNELTTLRQEREVKQAKLLAWLDRTEEATIETDAALNFPGTIGTEKALENAALANRPELLAMKAALDAADSAHLKSKMEYFPDTTLGVKKRVSDGWDAMLSFTVPLYFWKQLYGVSSVGQERAAAEAAYKNLKNMTVWEVKEAHVKTDAARRTYLLYKERILPQSAQAFKVALAAYRSGKFEFQNMLQIEQALKEAKLKTYENQVNYGKAIAELERIIGKEVL